MLEHADARVLITDREFSPTIERALASSTRGGRSWWTSTIPSTTGPASAWASWTTRRSWPRATRTYAWQPPADEWQAISLNYTSGTTGNPKGVVYHHRGAYLNALGNVLPRGMPRHAVYLWTLPMFHCNGWCFPWTHRRARRHQRVPAQGGRRARSSTLIAEHRVTHYCGAPIVHTMLINAPGRAARRHRPPVVAMVAGAAPPRR